MAEHDPFTVDDVHKSRAGIMARYEDRQRGDTRRVLATVEGRRFVWRILREAKILNSCFDLNALQMSFNEGKRDIGNFIVSDIEKATPESMEKMRMEDVSDRLVREAELTKANKGDQNG